MSLCLLHVYDVAKTDNDGTNSVVSRLNAIGRYTAIGGVFHGGIEVNGKEWSYGYCERGTGVYFCCPKDNPMYEYRETVTLGATTLSEAEVSRLITLLKLKWVGKEYDLLAKNCNHFCQEFAENLKVNSIPGWLNRVAAGADALAGFGTQAAEQMRWLSTTASTWFNQWAAGTPETQPEESESKSPARPSAEAPAGS